MWKSLLLQQMGGKKGSPSVPRRWEEGIDFVGVPNLRGNLEGKVEGKKGEKPQYLLNTCCMPNVSCGIAPRPLWGKDCFHRLEN